MKFEIKNRWAMKVQFTAEIDCTKYTTYSVKLGLAIKSALSARANLMGADLTLPER